MGELGTMVRLLHLVLQLHLVLLLLHLHLFHRVTRHRRHGTTQFPAREVRASVRVSRHRVVGLRPGHPLQSFGEQLGWTLSWGISSRPAWRHGLVWCHPRMHALLHRPVTAHWTSWTKHRILRILAVVVGRIIGRHVLSRVPWHISRLIEVGHTLRRVGLRRALTRTRRARR